MVVAAKSMFQTTADGMAIAGMLARLSRGIRLLGLRRMNMAMMLVHVDGRQLRVAAAGMPPALCYRAATGDVEELRVTGPPLGTLRGLTYQEKQIALEPDDAVLLMTDGLPQLVDESGELLGYERPRTHFVEVAGEAPEEMLQRLARTAEEFAGGRAREDDLTLVALRAR